MSPSAHSGAPEKQPPDLAAEVGAVAAAVDDAPQPTPPLRRAVIFMSASSFLVPAAGLLTQPVLAQALGVEGRGTMAAALAPAVLVGAVATLGLPEALTYLTARRSGHVRSSMAWAAGLSAGLGVVCLLIALPVLPVLSGGSTSLSELMLLGLAMAVPTLATGALRGVAVGNQMWRTVALEGVVNVTLRVVLFVLLWQGGWLTPLTAVLVATAGPVVSGVVYVGLLLPRSDAFRDDHLHRALGTAWGRSRQVVAPLVSYGSRVWLGAVAGMLVAKVAQLLMVPLASERDLGLYTVATTVAEVPLIVVMAASSALQGVNSRSGDADQAAQTSRLGVLLSAPACLVLAVTCPWWIPRLFGDGFDGAVLPTIMLLTTSVLIVPGLMAGAGLSAAGRPGLRSLGFAGTLVITVVLFVALVPSFGVIGACLTTLATSTSLSAFMVVAAGRVLQRPVTSFVVPGMADVRLTLTEGVHLVRSAASRFSGR